MDGKTVSAAFGFVVFTGLSVAAAYSGQWWMLEYTVPLAVGSGAYLVDGLFN